MEPFDPKNLPSGTVKNPPKPGRNSSGFIPFTKAFKDSEGKALSAAASESSNKEHATSSVEYVEDQGVVKKIIVTCSCGEVTEIDCVYESE